MVFNMEWTYSFAPPRTPRCRSSTLTLGFSPWEIQLFCRLSLLRLKTEVIFNRWGLGCVWAPNLKQQGTNGLFCATSKTGATTGQGLLAEAALFTRHYHRSDCNGVDDVAGQGQARHLFVDGSTILATPRALESAVCRLLFLLAGDRFFYELVWADCQFETLETQARPCASQPGLSLDCLSCWHGDLLCLDEIGTTLSVG